jgi:hypothetical protein
VKIADVQADNSPKFADYALVEVYPITKQQKHYRPLDEFARLGDDNEFVRVYDQNIAVENRYRNYDFSQLRSRFEPGLLLNTGVNDNSVFLYSPQRMLTSLNLISYKNKANPENLDTSRAEFILNKRFNIQYQYTQSLKKDYQFYAPVTNQESQIYPENDSYTATNKEVYLVFRYENTKVTSNKIIGDNLQLDLRDVEFQLISDAPVGNNRLLITGATKHPQGSWQLLVGSLKKEQKDLENLPRDTGIVFSN